MGLSIRAYARHRGVHVAVKKAIDTGGLPRVLMARLILTGLTANGNRIRKPRSGVTRVIDRWRRERKTLRLPNPAPARWRHHPDPGQNRQ